MQQPAFDACREQHRTWSLATALEFTEWIDQQVQADPWSDPTHGIHQAHAFRRPVWYFAFDDHQVEVRTLVLVAAHIGSEQNDAGG